MNYSCGAFWAALSRSFPASLWTIRGDRLFLNSTQLTQPHHQRYYLMRNLT